MSSLTELADSVLPDAPIIHTPLVRKKRPFTPSPSSSPSSSLTSSSISDPCNDSKKTCCTSKRLKHKLPLPATKECPLDNEAAAVMQDMKEAGTSLRIRRNLWYPVESLMQRIAMDAYLKVDKFYREKEGREGPVRNTKEILQEMSEEGKLPLIPRGDFHSMERLVEKIGYQAFVEIEEFYCEMEEYEEEEGEETETDI